MSDFKEALKPFADQYAELVRAVEDHMSGLSDADLTGFIDAARQVTQSNCWWATYGVAPLVEDSAAREQERRRMKAATS